MITGKGKEYKCKTHGRNRVMCFKTAGEFLHRGLYYICNQKILNNCGLCAAGVRMFCSCLGSWVGYSNGTGH